jgi:hypothetical protein
MLNSSVFRALAAVSLAIAALVTTGCATTQSTTSTAAQAQIANALSIGDIAKMVGDKRLDADIIKDIQTRGLRSPANASDLDLLVKQGTSKEVIDAILIAQNPQPNQTTTTTHYGYVYPVVPYSFGLYGAYSWGRYWGGGGGYRAPYYYRGPTFRRR